MVSFSCESCGDVLTKKKLDPHRNNCRGCSFTCLDCMVHFRGTEYRLHTSCISEAEKYQGNIYRPEKEKKGKGSKNNGSTNGQNVIPKKAYVEDAPDYDIAGAATNGAVTIVEAPPQAPSPPPAALATPGQPVNVFDFLVSESTPNTSAVALAPQDFHPPQHHQPLTSVHHGPREPMAMVQHAPAVFDNPSRHLSHSPLPLDPFHNSSKETFGERTYGETGFHYGEGPVPASSAAYLTPAPHRERERSGRRNRDENGLRTSKKDSNKRKRVHIEELDLSAATAGRGGSSSVERGVDDEMMLDAPLPELHSGLTGGLNRLLSSSRPTPGDFPPSPDYSGDNIGESPGSPLKRSKHSKALAASTTTALVRTKKPAAAATDREHRHRERGHDARDGADREERRARKKHRKHRRRSSSRSRDRDRDRSLSRHNGTGKALKAIEYHPTPHMEGNQLVVYRTRAELFMSFVTKGPDSEKGCSINKALKRYHRDRGGSDGRGGLGRGEEEKELWKGLRLRRNERGEVVIFEV